MKIFVLLPAFDEELSIEPLLDAFERSMSEAGFDYHVIVCDDGSNDRTSAVLSKCAAEMPIEVITHRINRGLGETSRDLFERAAEISQPDDIIVRMDCDVTHEPRFIPSMVEKLTEGYDVVIASRFQPGGGQRGVNAYRAFISSCANLFMKCIFPMKGIREYSCGFRAYRAETIKKAIDFYGNHFIQLKGLGFTCTLEKLVKLKILKARFAEVPFVLRYDKKASESKMVGSITMLGYLTMALCYHWPWGGWRRNYGKKVQEAHGA